MRVYRDTSVLVALLTDDPLSLRADTWLRRAKPVPVVSDFAAAAFASALGRRVRTGEIAPNEARQAFENLNHWVARAAQRVALSTSDVADAAGYLRRLDTTLRTPDALNIAINRRTADALATFDARMSASTRSLGLDVVPG